ncbi:hypothetical protein [Roseicella sp. DB1501]|uniref:hypothetical protein n=1 Tax=Roseicella sp. DB1501 TaxID=2730925 RepID=UPI0014914096|nr:hypothetical protein [Roseicella sp. DB1501]NOG72753.1 hypothetical protein [Roseicella sp. DB1501]
MLSEQAGGEAALAAERGGYDAFALGCFYDPTLWAARSLVDIPRVDLSKSCMLLAMGAEVLIPGDGFLTEFVRRHGLRSVDGAPVMDAPGLLFHYATVLERDRLRWTHRKA